jgi:catechol 2,3-dioxygenase-like lactoylglutathione lyase family enzyme
MADTAASLDHVMLHVADYPVAKAFYLALVKPLGMGVLADFGSACGIGPPGAPILWLSGGGKATPPHTHFAFRARSRKDVDAFHAAGLKAGGKDNGPPGVREDYSPNYYAAYVLDPDGNNIEAVAYVP